MDNNRNDVVTHIEQNGCEIISDKNPKHSVYVNTVDRSLKSALLKKEYLSDKYVINVCRCLNISAPVVVQIRNPNQ